MKESTFLIKFDNNKEIVFNASTVENAAVSAMGYAIDKGWNKIITHIWIRDEHTGKWNPLFENKIIRFKLEVL
jgi:precorrin-6B methylase 2